MGSDRLCVSLVRALMHDVDFLLVSSALDVLGEKHAAKILRVLRCYVENRGCPFSDHRLPMHLRHRKLTLYTSKYETLQTNLCHGVIRPSDGGDSEGLVLTV